MEMTSPPPVDDAGEPWIALSPTERESFFTAIERHRKAAWRVTAVSAIGIVVAAFVVAVLTAPLFYSLLGLAFDVGNIVTPTPNLLGDFMTYVNRVQDDPSPATSGQWILWLSIAALPGLVVMTLVIVI